MAKQIKKEISKKEQEELFKILEQRFEKNQNTFIRRKTNAR